MSATSLRFQLRLGAERNARQLLRADNLGNSTTSHASATLVTTCPGPLREGVTVSAPQKRLTASMRPAGGVARLAVASCAYRCGLQLPAPYDSRMPRRSSRSPTHSRPH